MNSTDLELLVRQVAQVIAPTSPTRPLPPQAIELARCAVFLVKDAREDEWPELIRVLGKMGYERTQERAAFNRVRGTDEG